MAVFSPCHCTWTRWAAEWRASPALTLSTSRGLRHAESSGAPSQKLPAPQPPSLARGRPLYANLGITPQTVWNFTTYIGISTEQTVQNVFFQEA